MSRVSAPDPRWTARARRARVLRDERPHAATLLDFYLWLLELQASVCDPADATRWLQVVSAPDRPLLSQPVNVDISAADKACRTSSTDPSQIELLPERTDGPESACGSTPDC